MDVDKLFFIEDRLFGNDIESRKFFDIQVRKIQKELAIRGKTKSIESSGITAFEYWKTLYNYVFNCVQENKKTDVGDFLDVLRNSVDKLKCGLQKKQ